MSSWRLLLDTIYRDGWGASSAAKISEFHPAHLVEPITSTNFSAVLTDQKAHHYHRRSEKWAEFRLSSCRTQNAVPLTVRRNWCDHCAISGLDRSRLDRVSEPFIVLLLSGSRKSTSSPNDQSIVRAASAAVAILYVKTVFTYPTSPWERSTITRQRRT